MSVKAEHVYCMLHLYKKQVYQEHYSLISNQERMAIWFCFLTRIGQWKDSKHGWAKCQIEFGMAVNLRESDSCDLKLISRCRRQSENICFQNCDHWCWSTTFACTKFIGCIWHGQSTGSNIWTAPRTVEDQHRGQTVTSTTHLDAFCYLQKNNTIIEQFFWRWETQSVSKWLSFQNSKYLVWLMFHTLAYSFQDLFSWIFAMFTASVFTDGTWAFADCRFRFDRS